MASNRFSRLLKILIGTSTGEGEELLQLEGKLERFAHFWTLVIRHFVRNRCLIRASALAYTSLLAMIPLLAVVISISTSLLKNADEDKFYQAIASIAPPTALPATPVVINSTVNTNLTDGESEMMATNAALATATAENQTNVQKEVAHELQKFVKNTQGAKLGVSGMVAFVLIAIAMLSRIEETFNDIWGVSRGRGWLTRVVLYWTAITLGPILLLIAISLAGGSQVQTVKDYFHQVPVLGDFILKLLPLFVLWLAFSLIYQIVPNTKVQFPAALVGGMVAGTLWHLNNLFGFIYVARTVQNSEMYGKLFLVPVFMLGLYFSWAILLFGAQVAYAFQNRAAYLQDKLADNINQRGREFVALRIMILLAQRFQKGLKPASVLQLATELGVPSRLTQHVLRTLSCAHLVSEVGGVESAYMPARPIDTINAHHILLAMRSGSGCELPVSEQPALADIYGEFARIEDAERVAAEKISLQELALRVPVRAMLGAANTCPIENQITQIADGLVVEEISRTDLEEEERPKNSSAHAGANKAKKPH